MFEPFRRVGNLETTCLTLSEASGASADTRGFAAQGFAAQGFRRPGFRPGLWSTGPTARPGTGERPVGAPDHSQGRNPWCVDDRGETPGGWTIGAKPLGGAGTRCGRIRAGRVRPIRALRPGWWGAYAVSPRGFAPGYGPAAIQAAPLYPVGYPCTPAWHLICP